MRIKEAIKMDPQPPPETQRIVPLGEMTGSFECLSEKGEFLAAILTVKFGMIPRRIGSVWYWVVERVETGRKE